MRNNKVEALPELASRLQKASVERLKDGVLSEWEAAGAYENYTEYATLVLEKAATQTEVKVPITLTGTTNILNLQSRFINEGWELKNLFNGIEDTDGNYSEHIHSDFDSELHETLVYLHEHTDDLKNRDLGKIYEDYFSPRTNTNDNRHIPRGFTVTKNGRVVQVYGSWKETA